MGGIGAATQCRESHALGMGHVGGGGAAQDWAVPTPTRGWGEAVSRAVQGFWSRPEKGVDGREVGLGRDKVAASCVGLAKACLY
jgi:hypothetical protein